MNTFIVLTAVEKAAINFGKENEEWLGNITTEQLVNTWEKDTLPLVQHCKG